MKIIRKAATALFFASLVSSFALVIPALASAQALATKKDKECKIAHAVCDFEITVVTYAEPTGPKGKRCDVVVDPPQKDIQTGKFDAKLEWEMEKAAYDAGWRIYSLPGVSTDPQFHGHENHFGKKYKATDRNTDAAAGDVAHPYEVTVRNLNGRSCSSDPTIVNKGTGFDPLGPKP